MNQPARRDAGVRFPESVDRGATRLRRLRLRDADAVFARYARDPAVTRWLSFRTHTHVEDARRFCVEMERQWEAGSVFTYGLSEPGDAMPFGTIDARVDEFRVAFGYAMARDRWGRGHAARALSALVGIALGHPGIFRAWACCDVENLGSARVMEKAGMSFEGRLRRRLMAPNLSDEPRDCLVYAKVR